MQTLTDSPLTIRCPYCMAGIEFKPMIAYKDGRFVCRDCAHSLRPGVPEYRCSCRPCLKLLGGFIQQARGHEELVGKYGIAVGSPISLLATQPHAWNRFPN